MILIKSVKEDFSTNEVIDWLIFFHADFFLLKKEVTDNSEFYLSSKNINRSFLTFDSFKLNFKDIKSLWYRKRYALSIPDLSLNVNVLNKKAIGNNIFDELSFLEHYIYSQIGKTVGTNHINFPNKGDLNRLQVFLCAKEVGLNTPEFIITNKKEHLLKFRLKFKNIVVKPISNVIPIIKKDGQFGQYTKLLTLKDINTIPSFFFPSMFQMYIEKEFEIRAFYLNGKFYSMAMFTQSKKQTKVDFRRYDFGDPVRTVPYKLSSDFENKLKLLFRKLDVNSGSVDILYTKTGEYVFLEINPVGQFGMISYPCNYYLERLIAKELIKNG